jgi:hypothetical protein
MARVVERAVLAVSFTAALLSGSWRALHPFWNWDMLPYMAAAAELDGATPARSHAIAYATARMHVPAEQYHGLVARDDPYRSALAQDPVAFTDQLPFYWIKPLYIALVWCAWKSGASLAWATVLPSLAGFTALCIVLFAWVMHRVGRAMALPVVAGFFVLPQVNEIAGLSTPDAVSAALIVTGCSLLHASRRAASGLLLLLISIAARLDNVLLVAVVIASQRWCRPDQPLSSRWIVGATTAAFLMHFGVRAIGCAHGWCAGPGHAFLPRSLHPQLEPMEWTLSLWGGAVRKGVDLLRYTVLLEFAGLALLAALVRSILQVPARTGRLLLVVTAGACARYLLFPVPDDRALIAWYATVLVFALEVGASVSRHRAVTAP